MERTITMDHTEQVKHDLETLIDLHGLPFVLNMIADVCNEKGDHVLSNWQDDKLANTWDRYAVKIAALADKIVRL